MQVFVNPDPQIVRNPLSDAGGVVMSMYVASALMIAMTSVAAPANMATPSVWRPKP